MTTIMTNSESDRSAFAADVENSSTDHLWAADFESDTEWQIERQGAATVTFEGDRLHIDCLDEGGVTVWTPQKFPADLVVEYTATLSEPEDRTSSRNLNCFLCAADENEPLAATPRSGNYDDYHPFPNYVFTLTRTHSRLRRDPGFGRVSELLLGAQPDAEYTVRIRKKAGSWRASTAVCSTTGPTTIHTVRDGWVSGPTIHLTVDRWTISAIE